MNQIEAAEKAQEFIANAPMLAPIRNYDLAGFTGDIAFLCNQCASRISARGATLLQACGATKPIWNGEDHTNCSVCGEL